MPLKLLKLNQLFTSRELATELTTLRNQLEADIQQAIGQAVVQYRDQLSSAQAMQQQQDREHQQSIHRLQEQVRALEVSLAGQATLPSVATSGSQTELRREIFNILPGTVIHAKVPCNTRVKTRPFRFRNR